MDWVGQPQWTAAIGVLLVFLILGMRFFTILFFEIDSWRLALKFRYIFSRFMEISIENSIHFFCNNKGLFVFLFFHHPSLLTQFLLLITHHLKYLNFLISTHLARSTQLLITHNFLIFVRPIPVTWSDRSC